ncbi:DNA internalization-related competence protein ComEC/Rec2 [Pseudohalioglobus sediminis]|uniref:DNA internalization-related competence protein ComEC/Rec2 n=1 Tax=Pseudohalioglobus sediminis TaxID=2606449 RepID=A0A5B0WN24_9GAMM|nr:DNA internalization-related competence protein ComEC/Rec2 [Pseudohalioglobus sediminis]KAA1188226.1 DNA internalization-related competence protein ComEC/Rec2 [Pseudohalioglobus sediminis]
MRVWMLGFLLGTFAAVISPWLLPLWLSCVVIMVAAAPIWRITALSLLVSGLCLAMALTSLRGAQMLQARLDSTCNAAPAVVTGLISSLPRHTPMQSGQARQRFELRVESIEPSACSGPRTLLLTYYGEQRLQPGERWRFHVTLRRPWGLANPGSFNMQSWYALSGIDGLGTVSARAHRLDDCEACRLRYAAHRLRQHVSAVIERAGLSPLATAVLQAVSVADKSGIDYQKWYLFQQYGINHLLVISGLHVAFVAGLAYLLGRLMCSCLQGYSARAAALPWPEICAVGSASCYVALAGFSVATVRALIMLLCFMLARICGRTSSGFNSLLLAALVVLVLNPLEIVGSGFWLSFGAVAALLWMAQWQRRRGPLGRAVQPHMVMTLLMLPMGAIWLGGSSWVAAPSNMLMVPLTGLLVVPLALLGVLLHGVSESLTLLCWQVAAAPLDIVGPAAALLAERYRLFVPLHATPVAQLLALLGVMVAVMPWAARYRPGIAALFLPLLLGRAASSEMPTLDVLDVGQGSAVVFRAGNRALLYDTGGGSPSGPNLAASVVLPWLRAAGVTRLDTLVISHEDLDHSAGASTVVDAMEVVHWLAGEPRGVRARGCRTGQAWSWPGDIRFHILSPVGTEEGNDASCVLFIHAPGMRALLAGDIGVGQERALISYWRSALAADVLLVGHHGSLTSTSQAWLNWVSPSLAIVGAGYASRFGHPHPTVIQRLRRAGIKVRETALTGAITVRPGATGTLELRYHRDGLQPWWM